MMTDEEFNERDAARRELLNLNPINKINITRDAAWVALQAANNLVYLLLEFGNVSNLSDGTASAARRARDDLRDLWQKLVDAGRED